VQVETTDLGRLNAVIQAFSNNEITLKSVGENKRFVISLGDLQQGKAVWRKRAT
jgi:hypothetical protein